MLSSHLPAVLTGMVQVGVGAFFAQASATGFVGQAAYDNRGVASGTYLACYSLAVSSATPCSASCSIVSAGQLAFADIGAARFLAGVIATRLRLPGAS
jgi:YNFM family putative membrane transporter